MFGGKKKKKRSSNFLQSAICSRNGVQFHQRKKLPSSAFQRELIRTDRPGPFLFYPSKIGHKKENKIEDAYISNMR